VAYGVWPGQAAASVKGHSPIAGEVVEEVAIGRESESRT